MIDKLEQADLEHQLRKMAWTVPEGWMAERLVKCGRCRETVLVCLIGVGTRLKFDATGKDHFGTCTRAPRQTVGRTYRGQHNGRRA